MRLFIFSLLLLQLSCNSMKDKRLYNNEKGVRFCKLLNEMYENDQKERKYLGDPFFVVLDSIKMSKGLSHVDYALLPKKMKLHYSQLAEKITHKRPKMPKYIHDSIMSLQIILDNYNTELLIDIIKKRGYPNKKNCNCKKFPGTVFRHSQPQYWNEIRTLIEKEHNEGRMNNGSYYFTLDHINGRKGKLPKKYFKVIKK